MPPMKKKPDHPSPPDTTLFQQALEGVTPLPPSNRLTPKPKPRKFATSAIPSPAIPDTLSDHGAGDVALTEYLANGLSRMTLRDMRRGRWKVEDELDLHGLTADEARKLLVEFLHQAMQNDLRCIRIIHGKGRHSEGRDGLLKVHTRHWLSQHHGVLAFCEAPAASGGGGAVLVLLRNQFSVEERD